MSGDFAEIDKLLCNAALREIQDIRLTDWMHGGTGVLKYFLQRTDESVIANYCHAIVNALLNSAVREETGSWFPNEFSKRDGKKEINLSLSHGQCGLLLILCDYTEKFPDQQNTRQIIHSGVEFLTRHQKVTSSEQNDDCCFPFIIDFRDRNDIKYSQRMAWCYGDLNETLLLYRAGLLMENKDWLQLAKQIGYACADRRNYEQTLAADSHFCHGASGLAAFYKHLYSISGDNIYLDASAFWINESLWLVEKDLANGNFESKEMSLIDGYAGVGAVLASSLAERKHAWMDMFLI
jgi:lantibiotic modifying enzyme